MFNRKLQRPILFASEHFGLHSHTISMTTVTSRSLLRKLENMLMGRKKPCSAEMRYASGTSV